MKPFKVCSKCEYEWKTRDDFLDDASLLLIGFQASYDQTSRGFYLFNHLLENGECNTTCAVKVENFMSLYNGPMHEDIHDGSKTCSGYCARVDDLAKCAVPCRNAIAREIMVNVFNIKP